MESETLEEFLVSNNVHIDWMELQLDILILLIEIVNDIFRRRITIIIIPLCVTRFLIFKFLLKNVVKHIIDLMVLQHLVSWEIENTYLVVLDEPIDYESKVLMSIFYKPINFKYLSCNATLIGKHLSELLTVEQILGHFAKTIEQIGTFM